MTDLSIEAGVEHHQSGLNLMPGGLLRALAPLGECNYDHGGRRLCGAQLPGLRSTQDTKLEMLLQIVGKPSPSGRAIRRGAIPELHQALRIPFEQQGSRLVDQRLYVQHIDRQRLGIFRACLLSQEVEAGNQGQVLLRQVAIDQHLGQRDHPVA